MTDPVVAGVDGSAGSLSAARHAGEAAAHRSAPLILIHGYLHPFRYGVPIDPYAIALPPPSEEANRMLGEMATELRGEHPGLVVEVQQVPGGPAAALVESSQRAQLVVVGSRGHGGFAGLLLGSVSAQVAAHAHCPVLVVRPAERAVSTPGPVVAGIDGSPGSALALALAADEAARRGSPLVVLHVWSVSAATDRRKTYAQTEAVDRQGAETLLTDAIAGVRANHPDLSIEDRLVHALDPEQSLVEASRDASVVVIGSRGRGGFTGLLLGSVSQALVHHGHCPILIAHPRQP